MKLIHVEKARHALIDGMSLYANNLEATRYYLLTKPDSSSPTYIEIIRHRNVFKKPRGLKSITLCIRNNRHTKVFKDPKWKTHPTKKNK